jgi:hypothetical protein
MREISIEDLTLILDYVRGIEDEGPNGEGWQSPELEALIKRLEKLVL